MAEKNLFRTAVYDREKESKFGAILVATPVKWAFAIYVFSFFALAFSVFVIFGQYSRKIAAPGIIDSDKGVSRLFTPRKGVVQKLFVKEGASVRQGDTIAVIASERNLASGENTGIVLREEQNALRTSLANQLANADYVYSVKERDIDVKIQAIKTEIGLLKQKKTNIAVVLTMARTKYESARELFAKNMLSRKKLDQFHDEYLSRDQQKQDLELEMVAKLQGMAASESEKKMLPVEKKKFLDEMNAKLANVNSRIADAEFNEHLTIKAPVTGIVSWLQIHEGQTVVPDIAFAVVMPENLTLTAYIFVPTKSITHIRAGNSVFLQYEAFPYQKYGMQSGEVVNISRSILNPGEIMENIGISESVYKVTVAIDQSFGKNAGIMLQPGMRFQAKIAYDRRSLFSWLLSDMQNLGG